MARAWKARNRERVRAARAAYYAVNAERERAANSARKAANAERYGEAKRLADQCRYRANREQISACRRTPEYRAWRNAWQRKRYHADPRVRLRRLLNSSLNQALRLHGDGRKTRSVIDLIGCSMADLTARLEQRFKPGMSWANHGDWHVDHIRPCASFDLADPEQQRACFHWSNLQPLWAAENQSKGARHDGSEA